MSVRHVRKNESKVIGITGGIASGKSTAGAYFRAKGYPVIDSDQIVKDLWNNDEAMAKEIMAVFQLDPANHPKDAVKKLIFKDKDARNRLNAIVHPRVFDVIEQKLLNYHTLPVVFVDVPLLFETRYDKAVDLTLLIATSEDVQVERLMKRDGISMEEAYEKINAQMPMAEKKMLADVVIMNDDSKDAFYDALESFVKEVMG